LKSQEGAKAGVVTVRDGGGFPTGVCAAANERRFGVRAE
jgi:hypothetical protein